MYYHILLLTSTKAEANTLIGLQICEILLMHTLLKFRPLHIRTLYHNKKTNVINSHHTPLGQPCMIQCQWLIYSNPHNVHIYISGSPRNNIFTHTLNVTLHTQRGYLANLLLLKESQVLELYSMFITKNWYLKSFSGDVFHSRS